MPLSCFKPKHGRLLEILAEDAKYKYLSHIVLWNVFFAIICIPTAGKMVDVGGIPLSIAIYYFPFLYIFSDLLTEVYGYAVARRVLWYTIATQVLATLIFQFVAYYPPAATMPNNQAFVEVLTAAPQLVFFGTIAVFLGDITNNYVLAKMKVQTKGRGIVARFVASTLCGQFVNTGFFYSFGLWGILPPSALLASILVGSLAKVAVEILCLPLTLKATVWLKKAEGVDFYDRSTNFNPLKL